MSDETLESTNRSGRIAPSRNLLVIAVGVAVALVAVIGIAAFGSWWYWHSRVLRKTVTAPVPPAATVQSYSDTWNASAIVASFKSVRLEGKKCTVVFDYVLENRTEKDLELRSATDFKIFAETKSRVLMPPFSEEMLSVNTPIYVPSHHKQLVILHLGLPLGSLASSPADDDDAREAAIKAELRTRVKNLGGFVIFDEANRYEIRLPVDW